MRGRKYRELVPQAIATQGETDLGKNYKNLNKTAFNVSKQVGQILAEAKVGNLLSEANPFLMGPRVSILKRGGQWARLSKKFVRRPNSGIIR